MSEIQSANHFGSAQSTLDISRSRFSRDFENILTLKAGDLVPLYWDEVLPGDTYQIGYNFVLRMLTPVVPIMDNAFIDIYAFYVPDRVLCDKYNLCNTNAGTPSSTKPANVDFETFMGANKSGYWSQTSETFLNTYMIPCVAPQSVANYLGLPVGNGSAATGLASESSGYGVSLSNLLLESYDGSSWSDYFHNQVVSNYYAYTYYPAGGKNAVGYTRVNGLPFACLDFIWNEWFRNENLEAPTQYLVTGNLTYYSTTSVTAAYPSVLGQQLCAGNDDAYIKASYVSAASPSTSNFNKYSYPYKVTKFADYFTSALPAPQKGDAVSISIGGSASVSGTDDYLPITLNTNGDLTLSSQSQFIIGVPNTSSSSISTPNGIDATSTIKLGTTDYSFEGYSADSAGILSSTVADSLTVDLANATAVTVNALRTAFATQKFFESLARSGSRYVEILKGLFGTAPDDSTLDRPEYLGGKRVPIVISQVTQTAQTAEGDLGEMGAFSNTVGRDQYLVSKSFKEHGIVMVVACIRTAQKYFQGIPRKFTRYRQLDYYFPVFANLGEQAVKKSELYLSPMYNFDNSDVFGYQEAWAEYRYNPDRLTGFVDPCSGDATLSSWTFQNKMSASPVLNSDFDTQDYDSIGNVLYDTTTISQFLMDIGFDVKTTRPMPVYSIPGLIDHH